MAAATAGAVLAAAVGGGASSAAPAVLDHRSTATVLQHGLDDLHDLGVSGTQGLVRDGGRVTAAGSGVADLDTGAQMPIDGYFRIGSTTKTFVSVVLLQLVGEGRIRLDDPIERWLPGVVQGNGNDGRHVTVRQVLQHTSGLYDSTGDLAALQSADEFLAHRFDHYTEAQLVATAMRHSPLFAAGTQWSYSNTNYLVAGMLIERVTGHRWHAEVRSRILLPLHLTRTFYPGDRPTLPQPHGEGYRQFAPGGPLVDTTVFNPTVTASAGGLVSTPTDLARFWQAVAGGQLLRPEQLAELHQTVLADGFQGIRPGIRYGLGIMWIPNRCGGAWAHVGSMPGMSTLAAVSPDGHRSTVLYLATELADPDRAMTLIERQMTLLDDLICG
ncbi:D-alanyl-D-alanine carboxypeptidase [Micromonospora luteifusca]|uniref:D-alanyl-D-alanine carboxypeptidase n=1 Tax=Micromonospora luteifusca TaxID=709860 RepID=A0ABS2LZ03_9ACTN|nr:serine hydrolase domain-containing protein [Micromonospora luteifusca]MBM7493395.1 D-alanyl-D-alanine carboxypeptidase [Micromonospora luteifusca]